MAKQQAADKFQLVTDKILTLMEQGVSPWQKPWSSIGYGNAVTGHKYRGINPLLAAVDTLVNGYTSPLFVGFAQAKELGWVVKKGSKSTWLFWGGTMYRETENEDGTTDKQFFSAVKWLNVFNLDCIDDSQSDRKVEDFKVARGGNSLVVPRITDAESLIDAQNAAIVYGGSEACYSPQVDKILMPAYEDFSSRDGFYATVIHELSHWTGHRDRLNRDQSGKFGTVSYAKEELIAELSAAFICDGLGIESQIEHHASYLANWMKLLRDDNRAFFTAAKHARKAANLILSNAGYETTDTDA